MYFFCNSFIIMQAMEALGQGKRVTLAVRGGVGWGFSVKGLYLYKERRMCITHTHASQTDHVILGHPWVV